MKDGEQWLDLPLDLIMKERKKNTISLKDTKAGETFGNVEDIKDEITQFNECQQIEECGKYMLTRSQLKRDMNKDPKDTPNKTVSPDKKRKNKMKIRSCDGAGLTYKKRRIKKQEEMMSKEK